MNPRTLFRRFRRDPFAADLGEDGAGDTWPAEIAPDEPPVSAEVLAQAALIVAQVEAEQEEGQTWWGLTRMDVPPGLDRPYAAPPVAVPPPPPMPCSGVSAIWVGQITYPQPGDLSYGHARNYAETLRHVGKATGTSTSLEQADAWPQFAIEAGAGVAA